MDRPDRAVHSVCEAHGIQKSRMWRETCTVEATSGPKVVLGHSVTSGKNSSCFLSES